MFCQHDNGKHFHRFLQDNSIGSGNTKCPRCKTWLQGRPKKGVCEYLQERQTDKQRAMTKYCRHKGIGNSNCKYEFIIKTPTQIIDDLRAQLSACGGAAPDPRLKDENQRLMKQSEELMQQNAQLMSDNIKLRREIDGIPYFGPSSLSRAPSLTDARDDSLDAVVAMGDTGDIFDLLNEPLSPISNSSSSSSSEKQENTRLRQQLDKVRQQLSTLLQDIQTF